MSDRSETAFAKINLALHVRAREADGYHSIETLFAFTDFGDELTATPADDLSLDIHGPFAAGLEGGADNLVIRAATRLRDAAGTANKGAHLRLDKRLPVAAGLGGGSADAAAALRLLNRMWGINWPIARLAEIGEGLGADVPACLWSTALLGHGRGDRLEPAGDAWRGAPVLLVNPGIKVATGPVFKAWDGKDRGAMPHALSTPADLAAARNDLEAPAIAIAPEIQGVLDQLQRLDGVTLARMSGSGATCFALFDSVSACAAAADLLRNAHPRLWIAATQLR